MSDNSKVAIIIGWVAGMSFLLLHSVYTFGKLRGMDIQRESAKRIECEVEFSGQPLKEIDGKCIKYFTEKE